MELTGVILIGISVNVLLNVVWTFQFRNLNQRVEQIEKILIHNFVLKEQEDGKV
jgi:putative flippase GtrA